MRFTGSYFGFSRFEWTSRQLYSRIVDSNQTTRLDNWLLFGICGVYSVDYHFGLFEGKKCFFTLISN